MGVTVIRSIVQFRKKDILMKHIKYITTDDHMEVNTKIEMKISESFREVRQESILSTA